LIPVEESARGSGLLVSVSDGRPYASPGRLAVIFERERQEIARRFAADGSAAARTLSS